MDNSAIKKGINVMYFDDEQDFADVNGRIIMKELKSLLNESKCNPYVELKRWRKLGAKLEKYMFSLNNFFTMHRSEVNRLQEGYGERSNKQWSKEEDELLIEYACKGDSELEISKMLGRTSSAIHTRLSQLVGIKRITQNVDGYFRGSLDGKEIEGEILGKINKRTN